MQSGKTNPILVTGIHRSGSTWVGKMLDHSKQTGYIHEPFNRNSGISADLMSQWFTYICEENEERYKEPISNYVSFKYPLAAKLRSAKTIRDVARCARDFSKFSWNLIRKKRPLVKDPISIFSAEWLYDTFDMDVVVLIRHPAAFAGSIKKAGWRTGMSNFLNQPLLIRDHLHEFEKELREHAETEKDLIDEAILLWKMVNSVILKYRQKGYERWLFVRHEDLSQDPVRFFKEIYDYLGLSWTEKVKRNILDYSTNGKAFGDLKRDSQANIRSWENRLTPEEIEKIRQATRDISNEFYTDDDW